MLRPQEAAHSNRLRLSALDQKVRTFPMDDFLAALRDLLDRGVRQLVVDRTFNWPQSSPMPFCLSFTRPMCPDYFYI